MERNFHWIQWIQGIQRIWGITEAWIGFSIRICSVTSPSLWSSGIIPVSYTGDPRFQPHIAHFLLLKFFCHWIRWIQWKHLEKTPMFLIPIHWSVFLWLLKTIRDIIAGWNIPCGIWHAWTPCRNIKRIWQKRQYQRILIGELYFAPTRNFIFTFWSM